MKAMAPGTRIHLPSYVHIKSSVFICSPARGMLRASVGPPQDKGGGPASAPLADSPVPGLLPVEQWEERPRDQAPQALACGCGQ